MIQSDNHQGCQGADADPPDLNDQHSFGTKGGGGRMDQYHPEDAGGEHQPEQHPVDTAENMAKE